MSPSQWSVGNLFDARRDERTHEAPDDDASEHEPD
jgi:hypothetical protein